MTTRSTPRFTARKKCRCGASFVISAPAQVHCSLRCRAEAAVAREVRRGEIRKAVNLLAREAERRAEAA